MNAEELEKLADKGDLPDLESYLKGQEAGYAACKAEVLRAVRELHEHYSMWDLNHLLAKLGWLEDYKQPLSKKQSEDSSENCLFCDAVNEACK